MGPLGTLEFTDNVLTMCIYIYTHTHTCRGVAGEPGFLKTYIYTYVYRWIYVSIAGSIGSQHHSKHLGLDGAKRASCTSKRARRGAGEPFSCLASRPKSGRTQVLKC